MSTQNRYLGVAVAINGRIFAHPADGTPDADRAAKARGDYPYTHLYEGDDVCAIVAQMEEEEDLAAKAAAVTPENFGEAFAAMDEAAKAFWAYPGDEWQTEFLSRWAQDNKDVELASALGEQA